MHPIVTLAVKDLRLLMRDKLGLFFIIGFPVIMGVFFGLINKGFSPESATLEIAVIDDDRSEMSRKFIENLGSAKGLTIKPLPRGAAENDVRTRKLLGFVAIPRGFGETAGIMWADAPPLDVGIDPGRAAEGGMLEGLIMQAIGQLVQQRFMNPEGMRDQIRKARADLDKATDLGMAQRLLLRQLFGTLDQFLGAIDPSVKALASQPASSGPSSGPSMQLAHIRRVDVTAPRNEREQLLSKLRSPWDISFPAAMLWGVMGCVAGFAISLVRERTQGTLLRLTVAPLTRTHVLAGKGLACFLASAAVIVFMLLLGWQLGIQLARPALLPLALLCVCLCFVGLMMLMSVIGTTEESVGGAGWAIIVMMCMFGGGMVPLAFMPRFMQTMSVASPVRWGVEALEGAIWRGYSFSEMLVPCGVLLGIGAVSFAVGAAILTRREV